MLVEHGENEKNTYHETETINNEAIEADTDENIQVDNTEKKTSKDTGKGTTVSMNGIKVTLTASNAKDYYGKVVDYSTDTGKYRIFYYDAEGEFGEAGAVYLKRDWTSEISGVNLSQRIGKLNDNYKPTDETKVKNVMLAINPDYKANSGRKNIKYEDMKSNEKQVMWLCDSENFKAYTDTTGKYANYINYVIGSPSVEMYVKSYNSVSHRNNNYKLKATYRYSLNDGDKAPGYIYSLIGAKIKSSDYRTQDDTLDYEDYESMYCGKEGRKGGCYWWLASPSSRDTNYLCEVDGSYACLVGNGGTTVSLGICPIVSLKAGVKLTII